MADTTPDDSILKSIKTMLGLGPDYKVFDMELTMHINSIFARLHQIDVGPEDAFEIIDDQQTWSQFIGNTKNINSVVTYMYLMVKLIFDPPTTSYTITAFEKRAEYFETTLLIERDGKPKE